MPATIAAHARFAGLAAGADVIHFQQTLNAYGADVAFHLLRRRLPAARVVTLHELDPEQTAFPVRNQTYNLADAVIVHDSLIKEKLVSAGVAADLVNVVCCGTDLAEGENVARDGIVFYGGHHLNTNKGLGVLLQAYRCLKDRWPAVPRLRIHGHYGVTPPADAVEMAKQAGVADDVEWLNDLPDGNSDGGDGASLPAVPGLRAALYGELWRPGGRRRRGQPAADHRHAVGGHSRSYRRSGHLDQRHRSGGACRPARAGLGRPGDAAGLRNPASYTRPAALGGTRWPARL